MIAKPGPSPAPPLYDCGDCGAIEGERCRRGCARVARYLATRCGAAPIKGQKLATKYGFRLATGEERCSRERHDDGAHGDDNEFLMFEFEWTDEPAFVDCVVCANRILSTGPLGVMALAIHDGENMRTGIVCDDCTEGGTTGLEWKGDRLVRKKPPTMAEVGQQAAIECRDFAEQWKRLTDAQPAARDAEGDAEERAAR